jgi:excisionase family DNA binding protein
MTDSPVRNLLRTLHDLQRANKAMQTALVEFEDDFLTRSRSRPEEQQPVEQRGLGLLSIAEVCQELGMCKSWVYRRVKSGEIPSIKVGHNIKVKRSDLDQYLKRQRYQPLQ